MGYISRLSCSRYMQRNVNIHQKLCPNFIQRLFVCTPFSHFIILQNTFLENAFWEIFIYTFTYICHFQWIWIHWMICRITHVWRTKINIRKYSQINKWWVSSKKRVIYVKQDIKALRNKRNELSFYERWKLRFLHKQPVRTIKIHIIIT